MPDCLSRQREVQQATQQMSPDLWLEMLAGMILLRCLMLAARPCSVQMLLP